jgi:cation diffusion facilitator CzcD-associated flavoprotein CzcO
MHSVTRRPDALAGQRVLVVGAGNSAGEISVELARAGVGVTLAVRTGASIVPREIAGIPIQLLRARRCPAAESRATRSRRSWRACPRSCAAGRRRAPARP